MVRVWTATLLCLAVVGCEARQTSPPGGGEASPEGCPETDGPFARGRVLVPDRDGPDSGQTDRGGTENEGVGGARREVAARDMAVTLTGSDGAATARSDANGRWCLDLGDREPGMGLVARAGVEGARLRRPIITREGQVISVRSEAVVRVLHDEIGDPTEVPPAAFLNLEAVASTATDLLAPVDWRGAESIAAVVENIEARIREDPRFANTLESVKARKKE